MGFFNLQLSEGSRKRTFESCMSRCMKTKTALYASRKNQSDKSREFFLFKKN